MVDCDEHTPRGMLVAMVTLLTPGTSPLPVREPARTAAAASRALRGWTPRQVRAAVIAGSVVTLVRRLRGQVICPAPRRAA